VQQPPTEQDDESAPELPAWSLARQGVGIALWASFLAAAVASVVCFAFIDPAEINALPSLDTPLARMTGYALGFFLFWVSAAGASLLTLYFLRTAHVSGRGLP
jgi:hypothetical protein